MVGLGMASEHDARAAKGIGDEAIRAGLHITSLNGEHSLRMYEIPCLAALALFQSGEHELCAHGPIAEQGSLSDCVLQKYLHEISVSCANSFCASA
jgi:hypothetical protein